MAGLEITLVNRDAKETICLVTMDGSAFTLCGVGFALLLLLSPTPYCADAFALRAFSNGSIEAKLVAYGPVFKFNCFHDFSFK
jgi:hypothetical protein